MTSIARPLTRFVLIVASAAGLTAVKRAGGRGRILRKSHLSYLVQRNECVDNNAGILLPRPPLLVQNTQGSASDKDLQIQVFAIC